MMKSAALASAVTAALAAAAPAVAEPAVADPAVADPAVADPAVSNPAARIQLADARFSFRFGAPVFGAPVFVVPEPRPVYRDDRAEREYRRAAREERIERRLEGRYLGYRPREIRRNLRDLGFYRIDIDPRARGYRVSAFRNGNPFIFRVGGRSGRIRWADRL